MSRARTLLTLVAALPLTVLSCTSSPGGSGGSGGAVSTSGGGSPASGGALGTGGNPAGGASTGGASSGGTSSGGDSSGDGGDSLGGEPATGGADSSGGTTSDGGTGGSAAEPYGPCDEDLGEEGNPACAANEVCVDNTCTETCPTNLNDAAAYDCPELSSGIPPSQCQFALGRCHLICEGQGSLPDYECPAGMDCVYARCVWP